MNSNYTYFRILMYLSKLSHDRLITNERIKDDLDLSEEEFSIARSKLSSEGLVDGGKTHMSLNNKGRLRFEELQNEELEDIYSTIFSNFEFTVIKFFYKRGGSVDIKDVPQVIKDSVPEKEGINDFPLVNFLFKRENLFITKMHSYKLNDLGKAYYFQLVNSQKSQTNTNAHQTVINAGNNNLIAVGNNSSFFKMNVQIGDLKSLELELEKNRISKDDITEIIQIVQTEQIKDNKEFGTKTKSWIRKMLDKALDGTWDVGIAVAEGILVEILKKYYGI